MCVFTSVSLPAQELLREQADRHHHELPVEPRVLEPEEQREAEDDRETGQSPERTSGGASTTRGCRSRRQKGAAQGSAAPRGTPRASRNPNKGSASPVGTPASSAAGAALLRASPVCPRRRTPNSNALHASRTTAAPTIEARTTGRCSSNGSWLSTSKPTTNAAFRKNAPRADSRRAERGGRCRRTRRILSPREGNWPSVAHEPRTSGRRPALNCANSSGESDSRCRRALLAWQ